MEYRRAVFADIETLTRLRRACERVLLHATDMGKPLYASLGFSMSESTMAWYPTQARR